MARKEEKSASYANSEADGEVGSGLPSSASELGSRISVAADAVGTRKSAAAAMGVSVDALARYIRGENMPSFDVAARLCRAAGRSMEWLATGVEPEKPVEPPRSHGLRMENVTLAVQLLREAEDAAGRRGNWSPAKQGEATTILVQLLENGMAEAEVRDIAPRMAGLISGGDSSAGPGAAGAGR